MPAPSESEAPQTTVTEYDAMGRPVKITQPDGGVVRKEYYPDGAIKASYGARTYPVEYTYDAQGRMKTMTTYQNYAKRQGAAVTTWNYDPKRGFLQSKRYADGQGPEYEYYASGKIKNRKWARGIVTTYGYTAAGELETIAYSDKQTPSIRHEYDRQGRRVKTVQGELITTQTFNSAGQMLSESYQGGVLDGLGVFNRYDALNRRIELSARHASLLTRQAFSYDAASRLDTVAEGEYSAQYHYVANSPLVEEIVFKQGETVRMKTRKEHDRLNRLKSIESSPVNDQPLRYAYEYNQANQRTQVQMPDQTAWEYGYDALGQVIRANNSGAKQNATGVAQFEYAYDDIGNRKRAAADGEEQQYQSDALNRYQAVSSGQKADTLQYDADGNLIRDGQWTYTWDAENRLITMESSAIAKAATSKRLEFTYDSQSRRIGKKVYALQGNRWSPITDVRFVYDGWNLLAELSTDHRPLFTYLWGLDLSGSLQGAGGVGGLLMATERGGSVSQRYMVYDGNGNVVALIDAQTGNALDRFRYDPFGNEVGSSNHRSIRNPFRFSTKYQDEEIGFLYYGYRYYQPASGKWLSRDPIGEVGGYNQYSLLDNDPNNSCDYLGMLKKDDAIDVFYNNKLIGKVNIQSYQSWMTTQPLQKRGAVLRADPAIYECDCGYFKWRQRFTVTHDDNYAPAPEAGIVGSKWRYYNGSSTLKNVLDIRYDKELTGCEWYDDLDPGGSASTCAYKFIDNPEQLVEAGVLIGSIQKVTVSFVLELVRVATPGVQKGGTVVLTINWGYWYTKDAVGLLNND
jgi:RHS repeat-associated protein